MLPDRAMPSAVAESRPRPASMMHESFSRLCAAEERFALLRHTVDGWSAWPVIRFEVSLMLAGVTFPNRQVVSRSGRLRRAIVGLPVLTHVKPARHLVKTYSSGLVEPVGDRYRDVWFDDVLLAAGSSFKIEVINNASFADRRALVPPDICSSTFDFLAAVTRCFRRPDVASVAAELSRTLTQSLGLPEATTDWVTRRLERFVSLKRVYTALLRRVQPSYVLVADAGDHSLMAAAKERGVTVLELQHGISDRSNAAYAWPACAAAYRSTMPIPNRLLLYGEHWKRELGSSGFWGDDLRVVGSPRIDRYRGAPHARDAGRCGIIFTSQGLDIQRTTRFLRESLERAESTLPLHLTIKLHPVYDTDKRPYLDAFNGYANRVDIFGSSEGPSTFELLQSAHLHVSIASASHYDALGLGVPTVILPFQTHEVVLPLQQAGHAQVVHTPEQLLDIARAWRTIRVPTAVSEYYFAPNGRDNVLRELQLVPSSRPAL